MPMRSTAWLEMRSLSETTLATSSTVTWFVEVKNPLATSQTVNLDDVVAWNEDLLVKLNLQNGNFESGFVNDPDASHQRPSGWTKYLSSGTYTAVPDTGLYRSSGTSWKISGANWAIGIYQQATGATSGNEVGARVSARSDFPSESLHHVVNINGLTVDPLWEGYE